MYEIKSILVPIDFSECSRAALDHALSIADRYGAKVTALHVAEVMPESLNLRLTTEQGVSTFGEYAIANGKQELQVFLEQFSPGRVSSIGKIVEAGRPRDSILRLAKDNTFDLIVMGTHGRTGRAHALAGSVTESVVRSSSSPVLTVREPR